MLPADLLEVLLAQRLGAAYVTVLPPHIASVIEQMYAYILPVERDFKKGLFSCELPAQPIPKLQFMSASASGPSQSNPTGYQMITGFPGWGYVPFTNLDYTRNNNPTSLPRPNLSLGWPLFVAPEADLAGKQFWAGFSGNVLMDESTWGKVVAAIASLTVGAADCLGQVIFTGSVSKCGGAVSVGEAVYKFLADNAGGCDMPLGQFTDMDDPANNDWGITNPFGQGLAGDFDPLPDSLTGGVLQGGMPPVKLNVQHYRVGAPQVLDYHVTLDSMEVSDMCDGSANCTDSSAADVFVQARAVLLPLLNGTQQMPACIQKPDVNGFWYADHYNYDRTSNAYILSGLNADIGHPVSPFDPLHAPRASVLYVEIGVWDDDGDSSADNIGFYSNSLYLEDLFNHGGDSLDDQGNIVRDVSYSVTQDIPGWGGNDCQSFGGFKLSDCKITYTVTIRFLRYPSVS